MDAVVRGRERSERGMEVAGAVSRSPRRGDVFAVVDVDVVVDEKI
jgi:hypothetical protein